MVCLRQLHVDHGSPQCVTVGTEGHVLMAFDVDTSMFAPTVLLLVTKHPSVHSLLGSNWERTTPALAHPAEPTAAIPGCPPRSVVCSKIILHRALRKVFGLALTTGADS